MAVNKHFSLSEDSSLTSLRQPWASWFNRQMKLSITGVAVKRVTMTTNNITNIHKENTSSGFEFWGVPKRFKSKSVPSYHIFFFSLAIIAVCSRWFVPKAAALNEGSKKIHRLLKKDGNAMGMKSGQSHFFLSVTFMSFFDATICLSWIHSVC